MVNLTHKKIETVISLSEKRNGIISYEQEIKDLYSLRGLNEEQGNTDVAYIFKDFNTECRIASNLELSQKIKSETIETLISCFSLHLVPDRLIMAQECFKVLKPGGKAGFSIWGTQTETNYFDLVEKKISQIQGKEFLKGHETSHWYLGQGDRLRILLEKAGFVDIKICEKFIPFRPFGESELETWYNMTEMRLKERKVEIDFSLLKQAVIQEFNEIYSRGDFLGFNVKLAICMKR